MKTSIFALLFFTSLIASAEESSWEQVGTVECQLSITDWSKQCSGSGDEEICLGEIVKTETLNTVMESCLPEKDPYGCEGVAGAVVRQIEKQVKTAVNGRESNIALSIGGEDNETNLLIQDLNTKSSSSMTSQFEENGIEFVNLWAFNGKTKVGETLFCSYAMKSASEEASKSGERSLSPVAAQALFKKKAFSPVLGRLITL